ncbi:hypothetical protein [Actinokineospora enzanensis]|uniref:hypothetical protein n=1 Tax=Actinokineospora enzanensis TaxID=155975 RepID=UPI00037FD675|nr:hypothetical protein [Actinokineospora enzanensis]
MNTTTLVYGSPTALVDIPDYLSIMDSLREHLVVFADLPVPAYLCVSGYASGDDTHISVQLHGGRLIDTVGDLVEWSDTLVDCVVSVWRPDNDESAHVAVIGTLTDGRARVRVWAGVDGTLGMEPHQRRTFGSEQLHVWGGGSPMDVTP